MSRKTCSLQKLFLTQKYFPKGRTYLHYLKSPSIFSVAILPRTGRGRSTFRVVSTEFIFVLLFINYCIIFHTNNCKHTFAPHCVIMDIMFYFIFILHILCPFWLCYHQYILLNQFSLCSTHGRPNHNHYAFEMKTKCVSFYLFYVQIMNVRIILEKNSKTCNFCIFSF